MVKRKFHDYENRITEILLNELDVDESEITASVALADLGAREDEMTYICVEIENEFMIELPDDAEDSFKTVGDIYNYFRLLTADAKTASAK